jgi:shikimate dehydrogenase
MIRLGLIGFPLGHSLSPVIQTAALQSSGLEGDYSLFPIHPDDKQGLRDLLAQVRTGEIQGLNVTIPHKQNVIEFLDELTPTAASIGAVNTIYKQHHKLIGDNTDAPGFLSDLKGFLSAETQGREDCRALVLGAGGSARAVIYALLHDEWEVTIAARRMEQVQQLMNTFANHPLQITDFAFSNIDISSISLIVNTTPVGMTPHVEQSPWPRDLPFPAGAAIYDLVYNPPETKLVLTARKQGLPATTGLGMLIEQAALAFEHWTAHRPSRETMLEAVNQTAH